MVASSVGSFALSGWLAISQLAQTSPVPEPTMPKVTVDKYTIQVQRLGSVSGMKMDMALDLNRLAVKQNAREFGGPNGGGFAGGAAGGGGGAFMKPTYGIALVVRIPDGGGSAIVEIAPKARMTDDQDQTGESVDAGPSRVHFAEFEKGVENGHFLYFAPKRKLQSLKRLEGELLVTPGRVLVATFRGPDIDKKPTQKVGKEVFTIESVKKSADGIQIAVTCPPTKALAAAKSPQERFQASIASRGAYAVELEDDLGEIHRSNGGGGAGSNSSAGGFSTSGGSFQFGTGDGRTNFSKGKQSTTNPSQSFQFAALPEGRSIKAIRVQMTDRTGSTKVIPFSLENIPISRSTRQ